MRLELGRRIGFTLAALFIYSFGTYIPVLGIDRAVWEWFLRPRPQDHFMFGMLAHDGISRPATLALGRTLAQVRDELATPGGQNR